MFITSIGFKCDDNATIIIGNNNLIPKTAINIPIVKNIFCQYSLIFFNTVAFTTALSNDKLISKIPSISAI